MTTRQENLKITDYRNPKNTKKSFFLYAVTLLTLYTLGAIFILRKDKWVGVWSRKWQFSLTLYSENVLTKVGGWFKKASKHPYVK